MKVNFCIQFQGTQKISWHEKLNNYNLSHKLNMWVISKWEACADKLSRKRNWNFKEMTTINQNSP